MWCPGSQVDTRLSKRKTIDGAFRTSALLFVESIWCSHTFSDDPKELHVTVSSDILGRVSLCCCVASVWLLVWVKLLALTWAWNQHFCLSDCVQALCPFSLAAESWSSSSFGKKVFVRAASFSLTWYIRTWSAYCVWGPIFGCGKIWIHFGQFCLWDSYCFLEMNLWMNHTCFIRPIS